MARTVGDPTGKLDSVQLLRAVAALAVVTNHIPLFADGAWGVDVFFVISGFIMCLVTNNSSAHFFPKRLIRIVPLYWLGTLGVYAVVLVSPHSLSNTSPGLMNLAKSLFFIPYQKGDVVEPVLFLGWTLNYEMFFYLLFSISIAVSQRLRAVVCTLFLVGLTLVGNFVRFDNVVAQFFTSDIILEFSFGMLCYAITSRMREPLSLNWQAQAGLLVAAIGLVALMMSWGEAAPANWRGRPVAWGVPASLLLLITLVALSGKSLPKPLIRLGDASFSLYLFHPYILVAYEKVFHSFAAANLWSYISSLIAIGFCSLISIAIYHYLELPVNRWLRSVLLPSRNEAH